MNQRLPARSLAAGLVLVALVAVAAGCGSKKEDTAAPKPQPFELVLDFFPNADHAGIYAAQADGAFRREGLDVRLRAPSTRGSAEAARGGQGRPGDLLRARGAAGPRPGLQVVAVGAIVKSR